MSKAKTKVKVNDVQSDKPIDGPREGERLVVGIVDNRGLTLVGYTDFKRDAEGMILIRRAQCVVRWWTGGHVGYLINGVCDGVALGAEHDAYIKEFYYYFDLPFKTIEEWKAKKVPKSMLEEMG